VKPKPNGSGKQPEMLQTEPTRLMRPALPAPLHWSGRLPRRVGPRRVSSELFSRELCRVVPVRKTALLPMALLHRSISTGFLTLQGNGRHSQLGGNADTKVAFTFNMRRTTTCLRYRCFHSYQLAWLLRKGSLQFIARAEHRNWARAPPSELPIGFQNRFM
jgi:hypothetical protein